MTKRRTAVVRYPETQGLMFSTLTTPTHSGNVREGKDIDPEEQAY